MRRRPSLRFACRVALVLGAGLSMGGCASFKAASDFGTETTALTGSVRAEFRQLGQLCTEQAGLVLAIDGITDDRALTECADFDRAQGQLAKVTLDVLDGYAKALSALADDRSFSVSPGVRAVGARVAKLHDTAGDALVDTKDANAIATVAGVLVDLAATRRREDAMRKLAEATPDLAATGRVLRAFFVPTSGPEPAGGARAGSAGARPPYANMVRIITTSTDSAQAMLASAPMQKAEPIRTAELLRALRPTRRLLAQRDPAAANAVPQQMAAAIDAWLKALEEFHRHAFEPGASDWVRSLKALRDQVQAVRETIEGS